MRFTSLLGPDDPKRKHTRDDHGARTGKAPGGGPATPGKNSGLGALALWGALGCLAAVFAFTAKWGYERLQSGEARLAGYAEAAAVDAVQTRLDSLDRRLSTVAGRVPNAEVMEGMGARVAAVESSLTRGLASVRGDVAEIREAAGDVEWRIQARVEEGTSPLRERMAALEAAAQSHGAERAVLEDALRDRIESLGQGLALELDRDRRRGAVVAADLEDRLAGAERRLDVVAYAVDTDRVDFETYRDFNEEVAPGIVLRMTRVDRRRQRIDGWIWLVPEARFLRFDDHPIQRSLVFYTHQDDRPHELVFTRVTETAAVGFVRLPSESVVESAGASWDAPSVAAAVRD